MREWGEFITKAAAYLPLDAELAKLQAAAKQGFTPLQYWSGSQSDLALVAQALLQVAASEAAVERTFSAQGLVHSKLRNRLRNDAVQNEMFVRSNYDLLQPGAPPPPLAFRPLTAEIAADFLGALAPAAREPEVEEPEPDEVEPWLLVGHGSLTEEQLVWLRSYIEMKGYTAKTTFNGDKSNMLETAALKRWRKAGLGQTFQYWARDMCRALGRLGDE